MVKILMVDDNRGFRESLRQMLSEDSFIHSIDETGKEAEVLEKVGESDYNLIMLDVSMPGIGGFEILKQIKNYHPDLPVLIVSAHSEAQYAKYALKLGAAGYLTKESLPTELMNAVHKVSTGGKYVCNSLAKILIRKKIVI